MPLDIGAYLRDTSRLSTEQHGAYFLLLLDYWINGAPPDDDGVLCSIARIPLAKWKKMRPAIVGFFTIQEGHWRQKRADEEKARAIQISNKRRASGHAGADAKRQQTASKPEANAGTNGQQNHQQSDKQTGQQTATPPPSPSPIDAEDSARVIHKILDIAEPPTREALAKAQDAVLDALGCRNDPNWMGDAGRVAAWLGSGADLEQDIIPTIKRIVLKRGAEGVPRSLKYFDQAIADAIRSRLAPLPAGVSRPESAPRKTGAQMLAEAKY